MQSIAQRTVSTLTDRGAEKPAAQLTDTHWVNGVMTDHSPVVAGQLLAEKQGTYNSMSLESHLVFLWRGQWPCPGHETETVWVVLWAFMGQYAKNVTSKKDNFWVSS